MEDKFNTGNLSNDINNISIEIQKLQRLENEKRRTQIQEKHDKKVEFEIKNTIEKVNQMISNSKPVEFEGRLGEYIDNIYGLRRFKVSLSIVIDKIYDTNNKMVDYDSRYMIDNMEYNVRHGNNSFGRIVSVYPYELQKNVTKMEYEHALKYLQPILPINVTIVNNALHEFVYFNTGYDNIYVRSDGRAYISGVSLTDR